MKEVAQLRQWGLVAADDEQEGQLAQTQGAARRLVEQWEAALEVVRQDGKVVHVEQENTAREVDSVVQQVVRQEELFVRLEHGEAAREVARQDGKATRQVVQQEEAIQRGAAGGGLLGASGRASRGLAQRGQ